MEQGDSLVGRNTVGATLLIGLMPVSYTDEESGDIQNTVIGTQATFERYWLYVLMALLSLLAFVLIIKKFRRNKKRFTVMLTVGILSVSLFTSYFIIATGYFSSSSTNTIKEDIINRRAVSQLPILTMSAVIFTNVLTTRQCSGKFRALTAFRVLFQHL